MNNIKQQILQPSQPDYLGFLYSAMVAAGGIAGYAKAGSVPSLAMGLLFGGILGAGSYMVSQNRNNVLLSTVASGLLAGVMGSRFYKTGSFMPAGMVATLSVLMLLRYGQYYIRK
ncbi:transmembrane protein 14C-like [Paramacrobiotus metropolitanus]|uniref:transmembrane protein 14C-like n=1 Tax=Paramacrobiotus metropolitanus TaxID=2943436 RepID=UPI0024461929|nr:transmembrane protein 14C-like [Paramacrobiotus metropolitanus]